jgi:hypothetical protein
MKECLHCKTNFEPNKPKQVYCSDKCRVYANRLKKSIYKEGLKTIKFFIDENGKKIPFDQNLLNSFFEAIPQPKIESPKDVKKGKTFTFKVSKSNYNKPADVKPEFKSDMEKEIWEDEQRILNSKNK